MPQGKPDHVPADGLTTRQRRSLPLTVVHTGHGKGKTTAAFGLALRAWNAGWPIGVFQFVKSAKWRIGEEPVFKALGSLHEQTGQGAPVAWHKMGGGVELADAGPSLGPGTPGGERAGGLGADQGRPAGRDLQALSARRVHLSDDLGLDRCG